MTEVGEAAYPFVAVMLAAPLVLGIVWALVSGDRRDRQLGCRFRHPARHTPRVALTAPRRDQAADAPGTGRIVVWRNPDPSRRPPHAFWRDGDLLRPGPDGGVLVTRPLDGSYDWDAEPSWDLIR